VSTTATRKAAKGRARNIPERDAFLLPYQARWVGDRAIMKIMEKSRRIGISYASAYEDVRRHSLAGNRLQTWVSSRDELTARQYVRDCMGFAKVLHAAAVDMGEKILTDDRGNSHSVHVIDFANGQPLHSLSSNPDAFAGRGGFVKLDEFALRKDPGMVYAIAAPTIDWGGSLAIISTHRGSGNYFHTLTREITEKGNPKKFSHHRVTLQDALDQGFLWKLQSKLAAGDPRLDMDEAEYFDYQRGRARDEETFLQEYMCVPADDAAAFLEYALIDSAAYPPGEAWRYSLDQARACRNPLYAGVDIGRTRDLTALIVFEKVGGVYFLRHRLDLQNKPFSEQEAEIYPWLELCARACIDRTGLGMQFAERAAQRFGKYRIEGVNFSGPVKEELAYPVRSAFEDRAIRIPFGDDALVADLRKVRKETTAAGNVRFVADAGEDGHADRFWALALAIHAGKFTTAPAVFAPGRKPPNHIRRGRGMALA
jgi:phage FluMu gp28-like protein